MYGAHVAANSAELSEEFAALEDFIRPRRMGALVIPEGGNPIDFRSPIDPSRDQAGRKSCEMQANCCHRPHRKGKADGDDSLKEAADTPDPVSGFDRSRCVRAELTDQWGAWTDARVHMTTE